MEIIIERGCGLDVHKETVVACIMGTGVRKEIRTYSTMTNDLLRLKGWLQETGITHVAMESTGVYWKPVFNILSEESLDLMLVNARHVKNVPGRKTDVKDSEWLCKLLKNGGYGVLTCDFNDNYKNGDGKPGEDFRLYTKKDLLKRLNSVLNNNDCKIIGDVDYDSLPDFQYGIYKYSFATYNFIKNE